MHLLLIFFSVIMILRFVLCSGGDDIQDLSDWCSGGRNIYYYLTSGAGITDTLVTMIATDKKVNCTLEFSVKRGNQIMVVLEFPDLKPGEHNCTRGQTSITVRDDFDYETCRFRDQRRWFHKMTQGNAAILFKSDGDMDTVKITATSMRDGKQINCSYNSETECIFDDRIFCMTSRTACDGHNNCGVAGLFDEDETKCKGPRLSFLVILLSVVMGLLTSMLIIAIAITSIPKRKETYIHNFENTRSIFDFENGIIRAEIEIIIIFPTGVQMPSL